MLVIKIICALAMLSLSGLQLWLQAERGIRQRKLRKLVEKGLPIITIIAVLGLILITIVEDQQTNKLHVELNTLNSQLELVLKKAEVLSPGQSKEQALINLLERLEFLENKDKYRPLNNNRRNHIINNMKGFVEKYNDIKLKVIITIENGNPNRVKVANDLEGMLKESGFSVTIIPQQSFYMKAPPPITVHMSPDDGGMVNGFCASVFTGYIGAQGSRSPDKNLKRGEYEIQLLGNPIFYPNGTIEFR
jgi:hypothetical protein